MGSTWGLHPSHPLTEFIADLIMSSSTAAVNTFNKSKEDFIWFVKKAIQDKKSYSYQELYHSLLKIFVDADTNKDGLVSEASFSNLIDAAASMPRAYGYAPADSELYKTDAEKDAACQAGIRRLDKLKMPQDRRCLTLWTLRLLESSPLTNG